MDEVGIPTAAKVPLCLTLPPRPVRSKAVVCLNPRVLRLFSLLRGRLIATCLRNIDESLIVC